MNTTAVVDLNQLNFSTTKKKGKNAGTTQTHPTPPELGDSHVELATKPADVPEPPPTEPLRTKKRKKTVVLDLSTVIPSPAATQVRMDLLAHETSDLRGVPGTGASV